MYLFLYVKHVAGMDYAPLEAVEEKGRAGGGSLSKSIVCPAIAQNFVSHGPLCSDLKCVTHS